MSAKKYVVIVHGLMVKSGKVVPYGTEVTDGLEVDNATQKAEDGFLLSKDDFEEKVKADQAAVEGEQTAAADVKKDDKKDVKKLI